MRRYLSIALIALVSASSLFAATSGSITLSGIIPKIVSILVTPVAPYSNLDLTTTQTDLLVANVQEQSNDTSGYTVTASSANAGLLKNGVVGSVAYTAKYNAVTFGLTVTPVTITNTLATVVVVNVTKGLTISYTGVPAVGLMSGTYSDTLTFTIAAK